MQKLLVLLAVLVLSGCATVKEWVPSFSDPNQSNYIVQAQLDVESIDCDRTQMPQVLQVQNDLRKFELYSQAKGWTQGDVLRVVEPVKITVDEWVKRGEGSKAYCSIKKKLLTQETARAASVILGRW